MFWVLKKIAFKEGVRKLSNVNERRDCCCSNLCGRICIRVPLCIGIIEFYLCPYFGFRSMLELKSSLSKSFEIYTQGQGA